MGVTVPHNALSTGYLSVMAADQSTEKEVLEAESPGTASDLNRSDLDPIYIGGLPASRPIRWMSFWWPRKAKVMSQSVLTYVSDTCVVARRHVVSRSYVGCIRNVEIARSNFDLLRDAYGVRKGCVLEVLQILQMLHILHIVIHVLHTQDTLNTTYATYIHIISGSAKCVDGGWRICSDRSSITWTGGGASFLLLLQQPIRSPTGCLQYNPLAQTGELTDTREDWVLSTFSLTARLSFAS